jgi:hypothetical protein
VFLKGEKMFTLEYAKDPFWNSDDGQQILLTVKFEEFNEEMPFTATSFDTMPYGVDLFNRAKAGEFGEIGAYVPVPVATEPQPTTQGAQTL